MIDDIIVDSNGEQWRISAIGPNIYILTIAYLYDEPENINQIKVIQK